MTIINKQQICWLDEKLAMQAGGKALGLHRLISWGLKVPKGFVILNADQGYYPDELCKFYEGLGRNNVAVRSSALGEDGVENSFAGQYESVLNVESFDQLMAAIDTCVNSLSSARAEAYTASHAPSNQKMNVVVQCMVDADSAGVMFTVDPVTGLYERCVIDAVKGLGESLVNGEVTPDHYELDRLGQLQYVDRVDETAVLSPLHCAQMVEQAIIAETAAKHPLDLEWAIDRSGELYWLQARPITTIGSDLSELNTPIKADDILTRCNVGEMMPGACCPLTFSTTGRAIEYGMQHMHVSYAGRKKITPEWTQVSMQQGQLFLNLSGAAAAASTVLGVDVKSLGLSVCGRIIDNLHEPLKRSFLVRLGGMLRLLNYLREADRVIDVFKQKISHFVLPLSGSSKELAGALDESQGILYEACCVHLQSSTTSGFASNVLQAIIAKGQDASHEQEAEAANLLAGAKNVESAVLVEQLDAVVELIVASADSTLSLHQTFIDVPAATACQWLLHESQDNVKQAAHVFLERHGHRSYRELCMREYSWADAPQILIETMQASAKSRLLGLDVKVKPAVVDANALSLPLKWVLPKAHNAIRRREMTKSMLVDITNRFKRSYRALGEQLVREKKLQEMDQVFFFTHDELMTFCGLHEDDALMKRVDLEHLNQRRVALNFQNRLDFPEISQGKPRPIDIRLADDFDANGIVGRPVSKGVVEGKARVALTVAEASALQAGEILVAPVTDVGWTPYFSMIAGLITDVGSAVSHGAVIAREYGLPAIVNTGVGSQLIKTGDTIRLDADSGVVTVL